MDTHLSIAILLNVIGAVVVTEASSIEGIMRLQDIALDYAVNSFNEVSRTQEAFKLYSLVNSITSDSDKATTFQLEFTVKQTNCLKANFNKEKCEYQNGKGKIRRCFACFKFWNSNLNFPETFVDCVPARVLNQKRSEYRKGKCAEVIQAEESHLPGMYAFSKGTSS